MRASEQEIELLLVGNPNAGKSTIFNKLTGARAHVGNWHGVTVTPLEKKTVQSGKSIKVYDLPGIYSTDGASLEEKNACEYLEHHREGIMLFVAECATLPRACPLFLQLAKGRKCMLLLTKYRQFVRAGGSIDVERLQREWKIPVLIAEKKGIASEIVQNLQNASEIRSNVRPLAETGYRPKRKGLSKADRFFTHPLSASLFFLCFVLFAFWATFAENSLGGILKSLVEGFFSERLYRLAQTISSPVLRSFVGDGLLKSVGGVLCFLPQIMMLFFFLTVLEESGLLSRLAYLSDGMLSKIGLSGRAVFSLLMGFGCTASAILTTGGLDDKRTQKKVIACLPYLSCSAKLPVYLTLSASFFPDPVLAALLLYLLGIGIAVAVLLFTKTKSPPLVLELAPLQIPRPIFVVKSLLFQAKQFIIKLATVILAFFLLSWLLSSFRFPFVFCTAEESMLADLCKGLQFLFAPIGCNDWRIVYAALSGLIAKENVAGAIVMFYPSFPYSAQSAFALAVFVLTCSPCVSAIAASAGQIGWKRSLLYAGLQTGSALLCSYAVYYILTGGVWLIGLLIALSTAYFTLGKGYFERIHRRRRVFAAKLHRRT